MEEKVFEKYKNIQCNNCFNYGHILSACKFPIASYGVIVFRIYNGEYEFLMINRKNSFGYIDLIKGNFNLSNIPQLQETIDNMSIDEKNKIMYLDYSELRKDLIYNDGDNKKSISYYKKDYSIGEKKFKKLKSVFINNDNTEINLLNSIIANSSTNYSSTEWEFPKGRCELNETELECALREFQEETGYSSGDIHVFSNIRPLDELFVASNYKCYKHRYYIAYMNSDIYPVTKYQESEVKKIQWKNFLECRHAIRPYSVEKVNVINKSLKIISNIDLSNL